MAFIWKAIRLNNTKITFAFESNRLKGNNAAFEVVTITSD